MCLYPALQWWNQPKIGAEWLFGGTGVGASNHFEAGGFIRSREEFAWPNIQYHFLPVAINLQGKISSDDCLKKRTNGSVRYCQYTSACCAAAGWYTAGPLRG